jgi:hypothetical protein
MRAIRSETRESMHDPRDPDTHNQSEQAPLIVRLPAVGMHPPWWDGRPSTFLVRT